MFDFTGKRVLITGGAHGIGAACAAAFHARGARVAIGSRHQNSFEEFAARSGLAGLHPAVGNVSTQRGAQAVIAAAVTCLGGLDVLVNAAGVFEEVPIERISQAHWDDMLGTNLGGTFFCSQAALPSLAESSGNIVNVASDAGLIGYPMGVAYSAAKGGVVNLTRAMAVELARRVRVNCVCPGNVDTDMIQRAAMASGDPADYLQRARARAHTKRMARPAEIAAAILYFASDEAASTTGAALAIDGGGTAGF
jgi:NAD(P)-dependent dehydrogenase (short-subunit alcohol dehydrogenase family)